MEYIFENSHSQPLKTTVEDIAEIINRKVNKKEDSILFSSNGNSTNISEIR